MVDVDTFQALADPTRRQIIEALRDAERPVSEIVARVGIHQSGVSRHLQILQATGFVQVRRDGPWRYYSLLPGPFLELDSWVDSYRAVWTARLDRLAIALDRSHQSTEGTT